MLSLKRTINKPSYKNTIKNELPKYTNIHDMIYLIYTYVCRASESPGPRKMYASISLHGGEKSAQLPGLPSQDHREQTWRGAGTLSALIGSFFLGGGELFHTIKEKRKSLCIFPLNF